MSTDDEALDAASELLRRGCDRVLLTLGKRGALLCDANTSPVFFDSTKDKALDTVGAGDCFVGSLAGFLCRNSEGVRAALEDPKVLNRCIKSSVKTSGLSVSRPGTQSSYPTNEEVEKIWES